MPYGSNIESKKLIIFNHKEVFILRFMVNIFNLGSMRILKALLLSMSVSTLFAQQKFEKETRVSAMEVPAEALEFTKALFSNVPVKWYKETGFNVDSYEAKVKYKAQRYSVEFSLNGNLEDVEVETKPKELPTHILQKIRSRFEIDFQKYRLKKVQVQYLGKADELLRFFRNANTESSVHTNYEIVVSAKKEGTFSQYEYLFDSSGEQLKRSEIILKMADNIIY